MYLLFIFVYYYVESKFKGDDAIDKQRMDEK